MSPSAHSTAPARLAATRIGYSITVTPAGDIRSYRHYGPISPVDLARGTDGGPLDVHHGTEAYCLYVGDDCRAEGAEFNSAATSVVTALGTVAMVCGTAVFAGSIGADGAARGLSHAAATEIESMLRSASESIRPAKQGSTL